MDSRLICLGTRLAILLVLTVWQVCAQPADVKSRMTEFLRYAGVENPKPQDVTRLAELWNAAQDTSVTPDQRRTAFRDLYQLYSKVQGVEVSPAGLQGLVQFAAGAFENGARMDLRLPEPRGVPNGQFLHVETRGKGRIPLLLIPDVGIDGRKLFESFVQRNADQYTIYVVTLPGAGDARPLPWPVTMDFAARPWCNQIERELLALVDQPKMKGAVVVGVVSGGYFAGRLAILRPQQIRAVVVVDALVNVPMRNPNALDSPATLEQRLGRLKAITPMPQMFPYAPAPSADELRRLINDPKSVHPTAQNWWTFAVKDPAMSRPWAFEAMSRNFLVPGFRYRFELIATDLTEELQNLKVPLLAMGAIHDDGSPYQSPPSTSQWDEAKLRNPGLPITTVVFEDSRSYINVEYPQEFERALADFLAGRAVQGKSGITIPRASPRASVMQSFGGTEVRISYGRPAVNGRKVWGVLVSYNRVWRAGANEATTFSLSRDVRIGGQILAAGTYTFFVIPMESEWTVIFNRVPRQWGAFNYNPAFDAVRFNVKPLEGALEEHLRYGVEPEGASAATVTLAWEKLKIRFKLEEAKP